jgi:hypothetical protein
MHSTAKVEVAMDYATPQYRLLKSDLVVIILTDLHFVSRNIALIIILMSAYQGATI